MPLYTYTGEDGRYYPTLGLTPEAGTSYDLDEDPGDGRWEAPTARRPAKADPTPKES